MRDWEQKIVACYPYQFPAGGFAFAVGPGWADLITEMCRQVDVVLEPVWKDGDSFRWTDMKEKFGGLRASFVGPDEVDRIVNWAEAVAVRTCDICGADGRIRPGGWLAARCDDHAE